MNELPAPQRRPDEKFCLACSALIQQSADFCPKCGARQTAAMQPVAGSASQGQKAADQKFCSACGAIIHMTADMCPRCGARHFPMGVEVPKSKAAAVALALLLGGFGIHKFYLGKPVMGIVYLVFFWTFIPAIVAFIEGIWYLTLDEATFQQRARLGTL